MRTGDAATLIDGWARTGVITPDQARRMHADLVAAPSRRGGLVIEGLGHLGGALVAVALSLITGLYWSELGRPPRPAGAGGCSRRCRRPPRWLS